MKLSDAQQHVVDRMKEGWKLTVFLGVDTGVYLKKDFSIETVSIATIGALEKKAVIRHISANWRRIVYKLVDA